MPGMSQTKISDCPTNCYPPQPTTAHALKKAWPEITLHIVPDAGHSSRESGTTKLLIEVRRPGIRVRLP
jgi:hypothetical protein